MTRNYCMKGYSRPLERVWGSRGPLFRKIRKQSSSIIWKIGKQAPPPENPPGGGANHSAIRGHALFFLGPPGMGFCRLACPAGGLGPQTLDLAPRQGDADFPAPFQLHPVDRLGVKAREVEQGGRFSPFDGFQVTLAGLQPDRGLFA